MRFAAARGDGQVKNMKDYIELPIEIDAERLMQFPAGSYLAADMRDEYSCSVPANSRKCIGKQQWTAKWNIK